MRGASSDLNCLGSNRAERHWSYRFSLTGSLFLISFFFELSPLKLPFLILQCQLSGELDTLKSQLNDAAREREALKGDKEQEREKRKTTEKELRQVTFKETIVFQPFQVVERQTASTSSQDQVEKDELNQVISNLKR